MHVLLQCQEERVVQARYRVMLAKADLARAEARYLDLWLERIQRPVEHPLSTLFTGQRLIWTRSPHGSGFEAKGFGGKVRFSMNTPTLWGYGDHKPYVRRWSADALFTIDGFRYEVDGPECDSFLEAEEAIVDHVGHLLFRHWDPQPADRVLWNNSSGRVCGTIVGSHHDRDCGLMIDVRADDGERYTFAEKFPPMPVWMADAFPTVHPCRSVSGPRLSTEPNKED